MLELIKPSIKLKNQIEKYKIDFLNSNEICAGSSELMSMDIVSAWLKYLKTLESKDTCPEGLVPCVQYCLLDTSTNELIGLANIRLELNDYLYKYGGNIGYSISPSKRKQGYGTIQLKLVLNECKNLNINQVLITCIEENIASRKVIEKCGGVFQNAVENNGKLIRRYMIKI